jgi:hypothetical protein
MCSSCCVRLQARVLSRSDTRQQYQSAIVGCLVVAANLLCALGGRGRWISARATQARHTRTRRNSSVSPVVPWARYCAWETVLGSFAARRQMKMLRCVSGAPLKTTLYRTETQRIRISGNYCWIWRARVWC